MMFVRHLVATCIFTFRSTTQTNLKQYTTHDHILVPLFEIIVEKL